MEIGFFQPFSTLFPKRSSISSGLQTREHVLSQLQSAPTYCRANLTLYCMGRASFPLLIELKIHVERPRQIPQRVASLCQSTVNMMNSNNNENYIGERLKHQLHL